MRTGIAPTFTRILRPNLALQRYPIRAVVPLDTFRSSYNYHLILLFPCLLLLFLRSLLSWSFRLNVPILLRSTSLRSVPVRNNANYSLLLSKKLLLTWVPSLFLGSSVVLRFPARLLVCLIPMLGNGSMNGSTSLACPLLLVTVKVLRSL